MATLHNVRRRAVAAATSPEVPATPASPASTEPAVATSLNDLTIQMADGTSLTADEFRRQRGLRQRGLVPAEISELDVLVLGVGAVGRQVALGVTGLGVEHLTIVDMDRVEIVNCSPQGYLPNQVGQPKVAACRSSCLAINPWLDITAVTNRCDSSEALSAMMVRTGRRRIVFACVDSISVREWIYQRLRDLEAQLLLDVRMLAENVRVLRTIPDGPHYRSTLFPAAEALRGTCGRTSVNYASGMGAHLANHLLVRWLRGEDTELDLHINLASLEIFSDPDLETRRGPATPAADTNADVNAASPGAADVPATT